MADTFRTLIVTAATAPLARQIAAGFGPGGDGMWQTGLSADGQEPATHFISTGYIPEQFAFMVPAQEWGQEDGEWVLLSSVPGDPVAVYGAAQQARIECSLADVKAIFATADVTKQEPFTAMSRMGLALVQPPADAGLAN